MNSNSSSSDSQATEQCSQDRSDVHPDPESGRQSAQAATGAGRERVRRALLAQAHPHQWLSFSSSYTGRFHKTSLKRFTGWTLAFADTQLEQPCSPDAVFPPGDSGLLPLNCGPDGCVIHAQRSISSGFRIVYPGRPPGSPRLSQQGEEPVVRLGNSALASDTMDGLVLGLNIINKDR